MTDGRHCVRFLLGAAANVYTAADLLAERVHAFVRQEVPLPYKQIITGNEPKPVFQQY